MRKLKWRKQVLSFVASVILMMQIASPVLADQISGPIDGSWLTDENEAETNEMIDFLVEPLQADENIPMPLFTYMYGGYAKISNAGDGKVAMYANTEAGVVCDMVKVDIYLQYYSNGAWNYVNNFNYTVKNTSYIARSRTVSVTKGRYYRIKCYHAITKNGIKESCTSATNGIKIE